jgi:hypothetical protein
LPDALPKDLPLVAILDGSIDVTGAVNSVRGEAQLLRYDARFILFLPAHSHAVDAASADFERVERIGLPDMKRSLPGLLRYPFAALASARLLAWRLRELGCERLQVNDFYLLPGPLTRLFGFRGRIVTWVRIDPRRYGTAGNFWLFAARRWSNSIVSVSKFIIACLPTEVETTLIYESSQFRAATEGITSSAKASRRRSPPFSRLPIAFPPPRWSSTVATWGSRRTATISLGFVAKQRQVRGPIGLSSGRSCLTLPMCAGGQGSRSISRTPKASR